MGELDVGTPRHRANVPTRCQDVVIGAGIAGLATAFHLVERGREVVVLESSPRFGGKLCTRRTRGMVLEQGPQSLQTAPAVGRLLGRAGLRGRITWPDARAHARFILRHGHLHAVPAGPLDLWRTPLLGRWDVARLLREPRIPRGGHPDESLYELVARRLGDGVAHKLLDPFIAGVFAGDPRKLDAATAFPALVEMEREHGSLFAAALAGGGDRKPSWVDSSMCVPEGGMQRLPERLADRLGDRLHLGTPVVGMAREGGRWHVDVGSRLEAERVWVCTHPRVVGAELGVVPRAPVIAVHLAYPREQVRHRLNGFGWLAPSDERQDVLGCLWVSSIFPGHAPGRALLRVMIGGTRDPSVVSLDDDAVVDRVRRVLSEVQGIDLEPELVDISRAFPGIPQYPPGFHQRAAALQAERPGVTYLGWHVSGVGMSAILAAAERLTAEA